MIKFGTILTLKGKTQKGKNRIRELGSEWIFSFSREKVAFAPNRGEHWMIAPFNADQSKSRWIAAKNDPDFEIVKIHD